MIASVPDACCGVRMFWFDRTDDRAIYGDIRHETNTLRDCFSAVGSQAKGTLIFKWNEHEVKVAELLALTDHKPVITNRCGKTAKSHWIVFMKPAEVAE